MFSSFFLSSFLLLHVVPCLHFLLSSPVYLRIYFSLYLTLFPSLFLSVFPVLVWLLAQFPRLSQLLKFLFPHLTLFIHAIYSWLIWINIQMQNWALHPPLGETAMSVNYESCPHNNKEQYI
jgi:hypothetical protein